MSIPASQERVRITAFFQGEIKHPSLPLSLGRVNLKLPDSKTKISLLLPEQPVHGRFQPLKFSVRQEGDFFDKQLEGLRLTADKAKDFAMSIYVFEPGPATGPRVLYPDNTIKQQETVRRSESTVPLTRFSEIEPGAHYRLEINSDERLQPEARLVKIEGPFQESKELSEDSYLFKAVSPSITGLLRLKVTESLIRAMQSPNCPQNITFNEDLAKRSLLTAINKLHTEHRSELEAMCKTAFDTENIPLGEKALGHFILALDRGDIGHLLQDQLEAAVGVDRYPILLGFIYNDIYVRFIDILVNKSRTYTQET